MKIEEGPDSCSGDVRGNGLKTPRARRPRGRPKLRTEAEQARLIARQARALFLERGFTQTTMEDIVARCGISKSTLYRLFPNKLEVFGAVIDDHRQDMLALPGDYEGLPMEEALAQIFRVDISDEDNEERMALLRFTTLEAQYTRELFDLLRARGPERSRILLADWLSVQMEKGHIRTMNADDVAKALMDLMFGAAVKRPGCNHHWPNREERVRYMRNCLGMMVKGLHP